ncbi:MAG: DUF2155 domain-containing protein, partial [Alphaproteobacteria bacterium]|nr:DUF2155 domain-containing protein [Alphaproteobacteria bacterium]
RAFREICKEMGAAYVVSEMVSSNGVSYKNERSTELMEISEVEHGQIFGGWMSRNEPGLNPLQHPDYDVWLVQCK